MGYLSWKLIHIASVVIFLGNIITGLFWAAHAHRTRDLRLIGHTFEGIARSDRLFTVPGVIGILVSGFAAAGRAHLPVLSTGWIFWALALFAVSGVAFGLRVAPLQSRIVSIIQTGPADHLWPTYEKVYRQWELWGLVALVMPLAAAAIMVLKPSLPGL